MSEHKHEELEPSPQAREWIELKFSSLRSEVRMYFILAVAGNQLLTHLSLTPTLGYITNGVLVVGAVAFKSVAIWR